MKISIAVHKENIEIIKRYANEHFKDMNKTFSNYYFDDVHVVFGIENDVEFMFLATDFLEKYKRTALYSNMFYYPFTEQNNKMLLQTIYANTRTIEYTGVLFLPNIFPYDEDKMIKRMGG